MGGNCCSGTSEPLKDDDLSARLNLGNMSIVEYERRVKKYASLKNRGKISVDQLLESFKDTGVFENIKNPESVVNRLVTSPFFMNLILTHN